MKKVFLDIGFDYDFVLYGIVSQETPHHLAWLINRELRCHFSRMDDLELRFEDTQPMYLSRFSFSDELNHLELDLFSNKDEQRYWLPELRTMDYLLLVKGALESFRKRKFTEPFKRIDAIRIISEINHKKLRQKERLIF